LALSTPLDPRRALAPVGRYLLQIDTHVLAFAIAANVLLSFYPFLLVMVSFCRQVLHWPEAEQAIYLAIEDIFAGDVGKFLAYNLKAAFLVHPRKLEWASIVLLLFTANGVFVPLEVALNRAWGVTRDRAFWRNQLVSTAMIFGCGALVLISTIFTATSAAVLAKSLIQWPEITQYLGQGAFKLFAFAVNVLILVLIYWRLPNVKVEPRYLLPYAVTVALALELLKWINVLIWPWLLQKFERETVVFQHSVTIITWSFMAAMLVLAGAEASARGGRARQTAVGNQDRIQTSTSLNG
jgi:membrane protein